MPETYNVDLSISRLQKPFFNRPDRIEIPRGTIVEWRLRINKDAFYLIDFYPDGLIFTIHFDNGSPFDWTKETYRLGGFYPIRPNPSSIILASGTANKPGDYKYGIKTRQASNNETLDDDDPYLKVI